jgi:hypothetical protein
LLAPLCSELLLDQVNEVADGVHGLKLGRLELDLQVRLDGNDQVDVVEGVLLGHACSGEFGCEDEGVVIEDVMEDRRQLLIDFRLLHPASIRSWRGRST